MNVCLVGGFNYLEKYEFVNGKDDIPFLRWKIKVMFETTNQMWFWLILELSRDLIDQQFLNHHAGKVQLALQPKIGAANCDVNSITKTGQNKPVYIRMCICYTCVYVYLQIVCMPKLVFYIK